MTSDDQSLPTPLPDDPMLMVSRWLEEARAGAVRPNADSMTLASSDRDGRPSARIVLCRGIEPRPGYLVFYTNYGSRKARQLEDRPYAAAVLHWDRLGRQVRIEGPVVRSPAAESDRYFTSRPWKSQLAAWASRQSETLTDPGELELALEQYAVRFGYDPQKLWKEPDGAPAPPVPRPDFWGGYRLWAERVELWVSGRDRLHDRALWSRPMEHRDDASFSPGPWKSTRLQP